MPIARRGVKTNKKKLETAPAKGPGLRRGVVDIKSNINNHITATNKITKILFKINPPFIFQIL